jgi:hypothetical protein
MNKKKLKYILIFLIIIILIFLGLLGLSKKTEENKNNYDEKQIKTVDVPTIKENKLFLFNKSITTVKAPAKIKIIKKESNQINESDIDKIKNSFGFENSEEIKEENYETYFTNDSKEIINIDKQNNIIEYSIDLFISPLKINSINVTDNNLKNKTKNLIKEYLGLNDLELLFSSTRYLTIGTNEFEIVGKNEANCVELKVNYLINNYPVYYSEGFPLTIIFDGEGNLIKFRIIWPNKTEETKIFGEIKEIKEIEEKQFKVISNEGDFIPEISDLENNFSEVNNSFGLINSPDTEYLIPAIILEGISNFEGESFKVTLASQILK